MGEARVCMELKFLSNCWRKTIAFRRSSAEGLVSCAFFLAIYVSHEFTFALKIIFF